MRNTGKSAVIGFVASLVIMIYYYRQQVCSGGNKCEVHDQGSFALVMCTSGSFSRNINIIDVQSERTVREQDGGKDNIGNAMTPGNMIGFMPAGLNSRSLLRIHHTLIAIIILLHPFYTNRIGH